MSESDTHFVNPATGRATTRDPSLQRAPDPRVTQALLRLTDAVTAAEAVNLPGTLLKIADYTRDLKRLAKQGADLPGEFERVSLAQMRGPTVEFTGRLLASESWVVSPEVGPDLLLSFEIWETQGGALVAASTSEPVDGEGFEDARVEVVASAEDVHAMRFAVMDHFGWGDRARSMARRLGWDLKVEVD